MAMRQRDNSLGSGVYYAADDYAGIARRLIIYLVDGVVLSALLSGGLILWIIIGGGPPALFALAALGTLWLYGAACKRSPLRTVGYWLAGCRLVDLQGKTPSFFTLTLRCMFWVLGPINLLFDLMWCGIDPDKQTLRDRYAETCLVRDRAQPIGRGEIHLTYFDIGTLHLMYPRVVHPGGDRLPTQAALATASDHGQES